MNKLFGAFATIAVLAVLLVATSIGNIGGKIASEAAFGPSSRDVIAAATREINKKLPMMVDKETRLDSTTPGPGRMLAYNYTLVNYTASQLSDQWLNTFQRKVVKTSCRQKQKNLLSNKISMRYRYSSADGYMVRNFIINPTDCDKIEGVGSVATPPVTTRSAAPPTKQKTSPQKAQPLEQMQCEIKPIMTDREIEICKKMDKTLSTVAYNDS